MSRFSSAYVAHTHKLLSNHVQTSVAYQINVVCDFDYFLLEDIRIDITSLYIIGYHKVIIVHRGWLILILRRSVPRSRYLIRRFHQMSMFLALVLQEFCLKFELTLRFNFWHLLNIIAFHTKDNLPCWRIVCDTIGNLAD